MSPRTLKPKEMVIVVAALIKVIVCPCAHAEVTTFKDEAEFVRVTKAKGPIHPPKEAGGKSINCGNGLFLIKPGPNVPTLGVAIFVGEPFPKMCVGNQMVMSDLDFAFREPTRSFGFIVSSETGPGFAGDSDFRLTLFKNGKQVGGATFRAPAKGDIFFGLQSTIPFDSLTLREEKGGPQNATQFGGLADREFFSNFYTESVQEKAQEKAPDGIVPLVPAAEPVVPAVVEVAEPGMPWIAVVAFGAAAIVMLLLVAIAIVIVIILLLRSKLT